MALIGEMQYLTIGENTYSIPISGGSTVTITRALTSGTKSATISVDGTNYDLYAPTPNAGTVTSVRVQATSPVQSSTSTAQSSSLNTTISLANGYGDTKNPYASKTKNYVLAAPATENGVPSFRALVAADIPDLSDTYATQTDLENLPEPMIFKGSLGTGGTITSLPTAAASNEGYTYKVITAGTYASQSAKVGDTFISDGSSWVLIPSGDEPSGTVTSVTLTQGTGITVSNSGTAITTSGSRTISLASITKDDTTSTASPSHGGTFTAIDSITYDTYGRVTGVNTKTVTLPADSNTDTKVTQAYSTANNSYPVLFSATAGVSSTSSRGATTAILNNAIYANPSTGNLHVTQLNGVTVGTSPKFTDTTYTNVSEFTNDAGYITSYTDNKVSQSASTSNTAQPILFRNNVSSEASSSTEGVKYVNTVTITPSTGDITATKFNGYILAAASAKGVDASISAASTSSNLPTSAAVASFVEGKGYITSADVPEGASAYTGTISAVSTTASNGTNNGFARGDHVHNITSSTITSALGYTPYDSSNPNGYISSYTDEKLKWTASTSSNTYYPLQSTSTATTSTANTLNGISFYQYYNTAGGYRRLILGNSTAYTSTGGAYGTIRLYGTGATYYGDINPGTLGANRTWTLPNATGTIALTSDIPDVSSFITDAGVTKITTTAGTHSVITNATGAVSFNIPTKTSHLTNDSNFVTSSGVTSITLKAGSGISLDTDNTAITTTGTRTISHADTSSQASSSNSGRTYIQSITLDDYGHVTGISTATESVTNTDTKLQVAAITSGTTYYPIVGTGTTAATRQYDTAGFSYTGTSGTTSVVGTAQLTLGNSTASGTANNKKGRLSIYGSTAYAHTIEGAPTAFRTLTLPDATGTIALTSDIPTVPTKTSDLTNDSGFITASHTSTYSLPLAASGTRGGVQIGYSESGTNYAVKLSSEKMYVSVPWTDSKVIITSINPETSTTYYPTMYTSYSGSGGVQLLGNAYTRYWINQGTASAEGFNWLGLGNNTAKGTAGNQTGALRLYGAGGGYANLRYVTAGTTNVDHYLPDTAGTILNSATTTYTQSLSSGTTIGTIKINGTSTTIYAPTNTDTKVTQTAATGDAWRKILGSYNYGTSATASITSGTSNTTYYDDDGPALNTSSGAIYAKNYLMELATTHDLYTAIDSLGWTSAVIA